MIICVGCSLITTAVKVNNEKKWKFEIYQNQLSENYVIQ